MTVEIDPDSGFCGGVIRAISAAERFLSVPGRSLYSLGAIVHNEEELSRLSSLGLVPVADISEVPQGASVLIRAHGVAPDVYRKAEGHEIVDCTCPVVLKLQKDIRSAYQRVRSLPEPGQVLIFGKVGHPEVLGLLGQTDGEAVIVEDASQLPALIAAGTVRTDREMELFSQTTKSPDGYRQLQECLEPVMKAPFKVHDTICSQVASRHAKLSVFAARHDVVLFVSGRTSSNGKVLCELCRSVNPRTYRIGSPGDIQPEWFDGAQSVGVCGATSTPRWLLEKVAQAAGNLQ